MRFDMICEATGIKHHLTKPNHPWTNGQVERMKHTIKESAIKRYLYEIYGCLKAYLAKLLST
jgi:transposase InsO family protein